MAHGCQLTACLSLQRARVEHRGFPNVFRALESFRLAMILRADRREEWSATLMGTRKLAPAEAGRWRGEARNLAATRLARANRRKASGSPFWFRRPRGFATAKAQHYHAQACSLGVSDVPLASQSGHLRSCVAPSIRTVQPGSGLASLLRLHSLSFHYTDFAPAPLIPPAQI